MNLRRAFCSAGLGALAAASLACRPRAPLPADCLRLDGPPEPVGFGAAFTIRARLDCARAAGGRIAWEPIQGLPLEMSPSRDGFELHGRMPPLGPDAPRELPWGVIPLSPRTRGEITLRARWTDDNDTLTREIRVAAAPRARGLPNTPVGARIYLGGGGWHLTDRPAGSDAALDVSAGVASLLPDIAGTWHLADGAGRALALRSARYDETPLDCGRAGCHPAITDAAAASPMTNVLAKLMDSGTLRGFHTSRDGLAQAEPARPHAIAARPAGADYPACALGCHATGEPGLRDGGFTHVVSELGAAGDLDRDWEQLPRDLHRLGGVGCLACHGPGAIPEIAARWSVLRADVCAVCHDAPPRYGHVAAWRGTAMARADRNPRARSERACARCHTTWGFLEAVATPERGPVDRRPPDDVGPVGITCSACHAVHDARRPGTAHLLRPTPTPSVLAGAPDNVCLPCHAPDPNDARPGASAAALLFARGGVDPATGAPLTGAPLHAGVAGGCVGCHRAGADASSEPSQGVKRDLPASQLRCDVPLGTEPPATGSRGQSPRSPTRYLERGAGHGFRAPPSVCVPCHPSGPPPAEVRARAQELWRRLARREATGPAHAADGDGVTVDRRTPLGRATWDLLLVLEDPAAGAHNARYAGALLDAAAPVIATKAPRRTR